MNVEEYLYDYAGNRIAKVTELGTIYYLVDTNGALSQVLAEYDENGSLTTSYTRGDELISQERNGVKSYYLYDGFDSVRMLTDEGGSVTDTYTFDAFGNLTDSTGDTENSYLYRSEQYDSFTGLYYLRARYMNPSTGTFITMDEYAGSVFEPVSLHKYLYANANPVMNSDPTGYFSLSELNVTQTIEATLHKMLTPNFSNVMKWINFFASFIDTCNQIQQMLSDGATLGDIASSMLRGAVSGLLLNKMCMIKGIGPILSKIMIGYGYYVQIQAFDEAIKDGDIVSAILIGLQVGTDLTALGDSCFTGDTLVAAENGQKRIDEIEIGDKVWAYNVETGETKLKTVTKVYVHSVDEILHLYTDEGNIDTTTNHPFYVIDKGWVAAGDLAVGDEVFNLDGTTSTILGSGIEVLDEPILVYNLEVEDFHSCFVGYVPVLVHNVCGNVQGAGHAGQKHRDTINAAMSDFANYGYGTAGAGGDYSAILGNRSLNTAGLNGTQLPDIITVRTENGVTIYDIYEFASPSQKTGTKPYNDLVNKISIMAGNNPSTSNTQFNFFLFEWGKY